MKIRRIHKKVDQDQYPLKEYGTDSKFTAAQKYCKELGFSEPVDYVYSGAGEIYTLLSASPNGNVIGKFEIW